MTTTEQEAYKMGVRAGLELAAQHCDECANLSMRVLETDCSHEANLYRIRAEDIRKLKDSIAIGVTR